MNRAIFLDRDGTIVRPRHYPTTPDDLQIYPGVGRELARLSDAGFMLIVITNQSGLARGLFEVEDLDRMHQFLEGELEMDGAHIDAFYYCPHHPDGVIPELAITCHCRKPESGMLTRAAKDWNIDLERSWLVGDILDDVEAGNRSGCRTILVDLGTETEPTSLLRTPYIVSPGTVCALQSIQHAEGLRDDRVPDYLPHQWSQEPSDPVNPIARGLIRVG